MNDNLCAGAIALYSSLVASVVRDNKLQPNDVCLIMFYIDNELTEDDMHKWIERDNPYTDNANCAMLNSIKSFNNIVPVYWYAISYVPTPSFMQPQHPRWAIAMNKIHIWSFNLYPRVFVVDLDVLIIQQIETIFTETPIQYDIAGSSDQFSDCVDRQRINGGSILFKPSLYLHSASIDMLYSEKGSCYSHVYDQSEQELINCLCGYMGDRPFRSDIHCTTLPIYMSVWPWTIEWECRDAYITQFRTIHYARYKPWDHINETQWEFQLWSCIYNNVTTKRRYINTTKRRYTNKKSSQLLYTIT